MEVGFAAEWRRGAAVGSARRPGGSGKVGFYWMDRDVVGDRKNCVRLVQPGAERRVWLQEELRSTYTGPPPDVGVSSDHHLRPGHFGSLPSPKGEKGEGFFAITRRVKKDVERFSTITRRVRKYVERFSADTGEGVKGSGTLPSLAGDRVNMTPLMSIVTYLIMSNTPFDEAQLILDYIHNLTDIRHPQTKRKKNLALGHLVSYVLQRKYGLNYSEPPTEELIFLTNCSFRSLFHENQPAEGEDLEGEAAPEPAPGPDQNAYKEIINRFGTMEAHFDQRFDQIELRMKT
ncbi:hypothetical protein M5K25_022403 [Dendrobium thyrsiflorum]|uniref:Uncharacterized protein n=1 Tax=Dendrobium thyrsiflorum TaxID=117978 RepID=A0ABD0UC91_DENTH